MPVTVNSKRSMRARLALLLALTALPLCVMSLNAVSANATQVEYLNGPLPSHGWYGSGSSGGHYTYHMLSNTAYYTGAGTVNVCQQVFDWTIVAVVSSKCGNQFAEATPGELEFRLGNLMEGLAGNNSAFTHTIHGVYVE